MTKPLHFPLQSQCPTHGGHRPGHAGHSLTSLPLPLDSAAATRDLSPSVGKANAFLQNSGFQLLPCPHPAGQNRGTWPRLAAGNTGVNVVPTVVGASKGRGPGRLWPAGGRSQLTRKETEAGRSQAPCLRDAAKGREGRVLALTSVGC